MVKKNQKIKESGQKGLFDNCSSVSFNGSLSLDKAVPVDEYDKLTWEKELLGLYVTGHPLEKYREMLEQQTTSLKKVNMDLNMVRDYSNPYQKYIISGESVTVGGIISNVKK